MAMLIQHKEMSDKIKQKVCICSFSNFDDLSGGAVIIIGEKPFTIFTFKNKEEMDRNVKEFLGL